MTGIPSTRLTQTEKERRALVLMQEGTPLKEAAGQFALSAPDLRKLATQKGIAIPRPTKNNK